MNHLSIKSDISAKVWKIVASAGDILNADDDILILESMKMEIPVATPKAGKLLELRCSEGDLVKEGDILAVLGF